MEAMSTDSAWEEWGRREPYFGVITNPKFRRADMTPEAKQEFFDSGTYHVDYVMLMIRHYINPNFQPKSVLEFGCGVGRLVVPFAKIATEVRGLDVSPAMLAEAARNCQERAVTNVKFIESDDGLSRLTGAFDLIHSCIVFQHIPPVRGMEIFKKLLHHLVPGGVGAFQFTYSKDHYATTNGVPPVQNSQAPQRPAIPDADPEMQMNPYNMTELLFILQRAGVQRFHADFTDHGGELGVFLFFKKPD
jgi:SAM-dependent methyltransferase